MYFIYLYLQIAIPDVFNFLVDKMHVHLHVFQFSVAGVVNDCDVAFNHVFLEDLVEFVLEMEKTQKGAKDTSTGTPRAVKVISN